MIHDMQMIQIGDVAVECRIVVCTLKPGAFILSDHSIEPIYWLSDHVLFKPEPGRLAAMAAARDKVDARTSWNSSRRYRELCVNREL